MASACFVRTQYTVSLPVFIVDLHNNGSLLLCLPITA